MIHDVVVEINGVWFKLFDMAEEPKVYFSKDGAIWMIYNPQRFNAITGNTDVRMGEQQCRSLKD